MQKILLFLTLLAVSALLLAQTPDWQWVLQGGGNQCDEGLWVHCMPDFVYVSGQFYKTTSIGDTTLDGENSWTALLAECTKNGEWDFAMSLGLKKDNFQIMETTFDDMYIYGASRFEAQVDAEIDILTSKGNYDFYVMKRVFGQDEIIWCVQAGGTERDEILGIDVDQNDNCYITGRFAGTAEFGSFSLSSKDGNDIFVAKISKDGRWLWATSAGGQAHDGGNGIAVDKYGNVYVTGALQVDAEFGNTNLTASGTEGYSDIFIAKLDPDGNWIWAKSVGGKYTEYANDIDVDENGQIFVAGVFEENLIIAGNSFHSKGGTDIFVAKADTDGVWQWSISAGGLSYDVVQGIDVDKDGSIYITGYFKGKSNFGSHTVSVDDEKDLFVAKIVE